MKRSAANSPAEQESFAEELDRRVDQRTAELTAANEQLREELDEHRRAEEALREGKLFDLIVESIPVPVAISSSKSNEMSGRKRRPLLRRPSTHQSIPTGSSA